MTVQLHPESIIQIDFLSLRFKGSDLTLFDCLGCISVGGGLRIEGNTKLALIG
jgi:hypothetical protein